MKAIKIKFIQALAVLLFLMATNVWAQTTVFTYQGKLTDSGTPQAIYQMEFKLFGSAGGNDQIGATITNGNVAVNQGVFTVLLDFGAPAFPGADRFLQISVRRSTNESFVTLSPRQQIASSPYSIRTLSAAQADLALDSNKLGGVNASEYVTTTSVGNSFIKNATTQQTANFNISGNGFLGGNVGIGTTNPQSKLEVNGEVAVTPGGSGGQIFFAAPNGETGMLIRGTNRADIRFDGSTLKLLAGTSTGAPISTNGIAISTAGNVGIGTTNPATKLQVFSTGSGVSAIYGESASGRGVWGKSTGGSRGVYGESVSGQGVFGISTSGEGVFGSSTSKSGVYGETQVSSLTAGGVYGKGTGSGSIGVIGEANIANAVGVYGVSTSPTGFGMYATNNSGGRAIYAEGNVAQSRDKGGLVKAMIYVNQNGTILRCYNGITNVSTGNCGFVISHSVFTTQGVYGVNFGFQVDDRFISITAKDPEGIRNTHINASFVFSSSNVDQIVVYTAITNVETDGNDANFMIIVY